MHAWSEGGEDPGRLVASLRAPLRPRDWQPREPTAWRDCPRRLPIAGSPRPLADGLARQAARSGTKCGAAGWGGGRRSLRQHQQARGPREPPPQRHKGEGAVIIQGHVRLMVRTGGARASEGISAGGGGFGKGRGQAGGAESSVTCPRLFWPRAACICKLPHLCKADAPKSLVSSREGEWGFLPSAKGVCVCVWIRACVALAISSLVFPPPLLLPIVGAMIQRLGGRGCVGTWGARTWWCHGRKIPLPARTSGRCASQRSELSGRFVCSASSLQEWTSARKPAACAQEGLLGCWSQISAPRLRSGVVENIDICSSPLEWSSLIHFEV